MPMKKPASFATWSPERQQAWLDQMNELERQRREMAAETAATNKRRAIPGTERKRTRIRQPSIPAQAVLKGKPVTPSSPRPGPSIPGAIRTMQERERMLQGLKKGGPVKKKPVSKKAPAKRGMGRAMRGR